MCKDRRKSIPILQSKLQLKTPFVTLNSFPIFSTITVLVHNHERILFSKHLMSYQHMRRKI